MTVALTSSERLDRCLRGQPVDRVPIWMLYNPIYKPNPWYPDYFQEPSYARVVESVFQNTDCLQRMWFSPGIFYSDPASAPKTTNFWRDQGYRLYETTLETPTGKLVSYLRRNGEDRIEKKYLVNEIEDLDKILSIPYQPFRPDLVDFFEVKAQLGQRGLMMVNLCDAISQLYFHTDAEDFLIWSSSERQKLVAFLDVVHARLMEHLKYLLEHGAGPVFFLVGSEFICPPSVSPRTFRDLYIRYNQPLVDLIHSYNGLVLMHHHGPAIRVLSDILALKPDGIQPPEAPPVGDTPLETAKQVLGKEITLVGNLQYDTLCTAAPEELEATLGCIFDAWKPGGRFILAPTAGPYQESLSATAVRNHLRTIEFALEAGKY